jgi:mutator protein MutT
MKNCVGIIIENNEGEILLQLRDEKPKRFPNSWVLIGGAVEGTESLEKAIKREIKEEMEIAVDNFKFFKNFQYQEDNQFFFHKKMNLNTKKIKLREGKKIEFFSKDEVQNLKFGFNIKEVVEDFFSEHDKNEKNIDE